MADKRIAAKKLFVFDLDGCLVDSIAGQRHALRQVCRQMYGLSAAKTEEKAYQAYMDYGCTFEAYAQEKGHDAAWVQAKRAEVGVVFMRQASKFIQPCGVLIGSLEKLKAAGWVTAVLTQGTNAYAQAVLAHMELTELFSPALVMGSDCVDGAIKRDPAPYQKLLARVSGVRQKVMAEDSPANLPAAKQLGFQTALVGGKAPIGQVDWHAPDIKTLLAEHFVPAASTAQTGMVLDFPGHIGGVHVGDALKDVGC